MKDLSVGKLFLVVICLVLVTKINDVVRLKNKQPQTKAVTVKDSLQVEKKEEIKQDSTPKKMFNVTGTVYWPVKEQTNSNSLVTADGSVIDLGKLKSGEIRWIAVSRDLLKEFSYGDTVLLESKKNPEINGRWIIHDTMNKRHKMMVDILRPAQNKEIWGVFKDVIIREL